MAYLTGNKRVNCSAFQSFVSTVSIAFSITDGEQW